MQQYADIYLLQSHSTCFGCKRTSASGTGGQIGSPDLATLEGSTCTDIMTCTGSCGYSF